MKNLVCCIFICLSLTTFAQKECNDIIYAQESSRILFNCCILEVSDANNVVYVKAGDTLEVRAYAITKDGEYLELVENPNKPMVMEMQEDEEPELYRKHNYAYYQKLYYGSKKRQGVGIFLTILGVGLEIGGIVIASNEYVTDAELITAGNLILIGSLMETVGIPLWISGAIRKANNRKAMEEIDRNRGLTLGVNNYGFGLTYKF